MSENAPAESKEFHGVRITPKCIQTIRKGEATFSIPRDGIQALSIQFGFIAERPFLQMIFGLFLAVFGLFPIRGIIAWALFGGTVYDVIFLLPLLVPFGIWLITNSLRRGYYIRVTLINTKYKVHFRGKPKLNDIIEFLREECRSNGYSLDLDNKHLLPGYDHNSVA